MSSSGVTSKIDLDNKIDFIVSEIMRELSDNRNAANGLYEEFRAKWKAGSTDESTQMQLVSSLKNIVGTTDRRIRLLESLVKLKMLESTSVQQSNDNLTQDDVNKNEILKTLEEMKKK